jgi:hypothetical protein
VKVCLVLGAGATLANAQYFHESRTRDWPPLDVTFFEALERRRIALTPALRRYFVEVVGVEPTPTALREIRMEEVFKDAFYDLEESPASARILDGYTDLVDIYLRLLRETTNWLCDPKRRAAPVGRLLDAAASRAESLTVITFNHDLVIENEILKRTRLRQRWCLDVGYGAVTSSFTLVVPTSSRVSLFPVHSEGECSHDQPITVLKLHGSLNWFVRLGGARPTANFLRGKGATTGVSLYSATHVPAQPVWQRPGPGRKQWNMWPVVVPPVYAKQALRAAIQASWSDARTALEAADRVVFFGYSLPEIDIEAQKLFERAIGAGKAEWIDVVNPGVESAARFAEVGKTLPVRWYHGIDDFLKAKPLG